ncbi:MAG: peptidylprolyl isomerase [Roseivirga sp.]|nr:peptidylprolyl isomerase [Roseivirga sp.]
MRYLAVLVLSFLTMTCSSQKKALLNPASPEWTKSAPDSFVVKVETSKGDFELTITRDFAPIGADRFYNLVRLGYYDNARFHRVVPGFIVQFGLAGKPEVSQIWMNEPITDDVNKISNERGTIAFAFTESGTRTTQLYINTVDNSRLDAQGFAPLGRVTRGMEVVDQLYSGYGENSGGGVRRGDQSKIVAEGNVYLDREFPRLDRIIRAYIVK